MSRLKHAPSRRATRSERRVFRNPRNQAAASPETGAVIAEDLHFTYPGSEVAALDGVSLHVSPGEFVYLVGSSGSGKSSLLRSLYADVHPTQGRLRVCGVNMIRLRSGRVPGLRRRLGVVFQDFKLLENRTVYQQIRFVLRVLGREQGCDPVIARVLDLVGLADKADRMPHELSGGEQQRIALARALVVEPEILLADEPTGNLDPVTGKAILDVLERINQAGTTVLMATHDQRLVDATGHRVVAMSQGRIVRDDRAGGYLAGAR